MDDVMRRRLQEAIRSGNAAVARAEAESARIEAALERSKKVTREAIPVLTAAGLIKPRGPQARRARIRCRLGWHAWFSYRSEPLRLMRHGVATEVEATDMRRCTSCHSLQVVGSR